jgi:hypothetical protein
MDACTYESITGLKNYYGFKSLLKNGLATQRYGCDDETIVFNRVVSVSSQLYTYFNPFNLATNQVAVLLNSSSQFISFYQPFPELMMFGDVDGFVISTQPDSLLLGQVITGSIIPASSGVGLNITVTIAIFDLF